MLLCYHSHSPFQFLFKTNSHFRGNPMGTPVPINTSTRVTMNDLAQYSMTHTKRRVASLGQLSFLLKCTRRACK